MQAQKRQQNQVTVFEPKELLEAVQANPLAAFTVGPKKNPPKVPAKGGVKFLEGGWNLRGKKRAEGWFAISDMPVRAIADPTDGSDVRNQFQCRSNLQADLSTAGIFGQAVSLANPAWQTRAKEMVDKGEIKLMPNQYIKDLLRLKLSMRNEKTPGADLEDPGLSFKIDFRPFAATYRHEELQNKPKTTFYDYTKTYVDEKTGKTKYELATVADPKTGEQVPVCDANMHLFVNEGSVLRAGRVLWESPVISEKCLSWPMLINVAVIEPGGPKEFENDPTCVDVVSNVSTNVGANVSTNNTTLSALETALGIGASTGVVASGPQTNHPIPPCKPIPVPEPMSTHPMANLSVEPPAEVDDLADALNDL